MRSFFSLSIRASSSLLRISDFKSSFLRFYEDALETFDGAALPVLLITDLSVSPRYYFSRGGLEEVGTGGFFKATG